jgi:hypothetical protein
VPRVASKYQKQRENTIYFWSEQKNMLPATPTGKDCIDGAESAEYRVTAGA